MTVTAPDTDRCLNPDQVAVGTANGPGIYAGPAGTLVPALSVDEWPEPWACIGYLSDDGPTVGQSTDSEDITPWQSVTPIRSVITSRGVNLQFVMWQLNALTLSMYFDVDPPEPEADGSLDFEVRTDTPSHIWAIGIDVRDAELIFRLGFFRASLSDAGDLSITRGSAIGLDVTLSALDDGGRLANIKMSGQTGASSAGLVVSRNDLVTAQGGKGRSGGAASGGRDLAGAEDLSSGARARRAAGQRTGEE